MCCTLGRGVDLSLAIGRTGHAFLLVLALPDEILLRFFLDLKFRAFAFELLRSRFFSRSRSSFFRARAFAFPVSFPARGSPERDRQNRTSRTRQAEQDNQNETGRTGHLNGTGRTGKAEQDRQNTTGRTGLPSYIGANSCSRFHYILFVC
jgi:hypothetical protein